MVVDGTSGASGDGAGRTFANKAELADYLEAQADDLEQLQAADPASAELVSALASDFAELARAHDLEFVASRFDRFKRSAATGTEGAS